MSDYIIHNLNIVVNPTIDFDNNVEGDKPVDKYPNYYIGKIIGGSGNELVLNRNRQGGAKEHVPNCVLRNDNGVALIRVHNKENLMIYDLPQNSDNEPDECVGEQLSSYPYAYVVVDYRDGKCQMAIEKTTSWDSKTITIRNSFQEFFYEKLYRDYGITVGIKEKTEKTKFEEFIDERIIDCKDAIESFTFQYVNTKRHPTARIPEPLTEEIDIMSKILEIHDALSGTTTFNMGKKVDTDKLKQLSTVVTMCSDNSFDMSVKFRDYGDYICNEDIIAKYPMNDVVISHFKGFITPEWISSGSDLVSWLDEVFENIRKGKHDEKIPIKPM